MNASCSGQYFPMAQLFLLSCRNLCWERVRPQLSVLVLELILLCYILALSQCFMVLFNVQLTMTSLWSYFISYCVQDKNKCLTHSRILLPWSPRGFALLLRYQTSSVVLVSQLLPQWLLIRLGKETSIPIQGMVQSLGFSFLGSRNWCKIPNMQTDVLLLRTAAACSIDLGIWLIPLPSRKKC